jgi:hypothetical protein
MEDFVVFFDQPGVHTIAIQGKAPNSNVWFYLNDWTATIERVNNATKI